MHSRRTGRSRRGTLLVVVLGLLVALFVIGTSFSYVTLSERRAAGNYLDRSRALDLALDGIEYSIARLRAESTQKHYQGIGPSTAGVVDGEYNPRDFALRPLDSTEPAVSWPKNRSATSTDSNAPDGNWADVDGDGGKGSNETGWGTNLIAPGIGVGAKGFSATVTGFQGDGLNTGKASNDVPREGNLTYGPSGTYTEFGNYFRVRAVDASSMLNLNNFKGKQLVDTLVVLGAAIDDWIAGGSTKGEYNPFPEDIAKKIGVLSDNQSFAISSKEQIRPLYNDIPRGEALYNLGMMFVTTRSYIDNSYRDWCEYNLDVPKNGNPRNLTRAQLWREGFTSSDTEGRDGWPDWQHDNASRFGKSPVNINTAPKPVLVCLFANLASNARLLYYRKQDQITKEDKLFKEVFGATVRRQETGTTDLGRQNNHATGGAGMAQEGLWYPPGDSNRAIFQLVPIGPISTKFGSGNTSSSGGRDYASALADAVIAMRKQSAFMSWQDFDARFCRGLLLGLPATGREQLRFPDVVGIKRGGLTTTPVTGAFPADLLPPADNCEHGANPLRSADSSMNEDAFRAWYWKSTVDMIRAALNPNNVSNRGNPDYPYYQNVDRMDLTVSTAPLCFSSMGVYELTSQGEMLAKPRGYDAGRDTAIDVSLMLPVARRQVRTVVKIYDVMRQTSQRDFMWPLDPIILNPPTLQAGQTAPAAETLVSHSHFDTKTYPFSINEMSNGSWRAEPPAWDANLDPLEDARGLKYKGDNEQAEDRIKGHNSYINASTEFGYVGLNPRDRTPVKQTSPPIGQLSFWARFNEGLRARNARPGFLIFGVNSDNSGQDNLWGHYPWEKEAIFDDFISSASPRSIEPAIDGQAKSEFENSNDGGEAGKYANLRPDGVLLTGGSLRPKASKGEAELGATFGRRGLQRLPRLKILRYPCGSQYSNRPFSPIRDANGASFAVGIDDTKQTNYAPPSSIDKQITIDRMIGGPGTNYRSHDEHNRNVQTMRQTNSNMPYYEGTVDFWIKWDLPPQGTDSSAAVPANFQNQVVCMGELDPASHNYSGLFGATAYGRLGDRTGANSNSVTNQDRYTKASSSDRNVEADFEGVQFFVYKEPGGVFRFTRLYFAEAFGMAVDTSGSSTSSAPSNVGQFGIAMRRVYDPVAVDGWSGFTGTSDICNDVGISGENMGFLYARTDAWVNLYEATSDGPGGTKPVMLRVHDWHRFTLSYNSKSDSPYQLWIDGRLVTPVTFFPEPPGDPNLKYKFRNDGRHRDQQTKLFDQPIPQPVPSSGIAWDFFRTTNKLFEINPEDRLTVGCIFRRQLDNAGTQNDWNKYYGELDDDLSGAEAVKPSRPVFKFDSNFVAVANATIDDFRITRTLILPADNSAIDLSNLRVNSRYAGQTDKPAYFEGGFLPVRSEDGQLHSIPLRLGTISWTEYRPDWDPFAVRGMNLETSNRLEVEWAVFDDITKMTSGGESSESRDLMRQAKSGTSGARIGGSTQSDDYWAMGGMSLRGEILPCSGTTAGMLVYRVYFRTGDNIEVNNTTAILDDVTVTVLTPPRKLGFAIDY